MKWLLQPALTISQDILQWPKVKRKMPRTNCRVWDWTVLQANKLVCHSARDVETPRWVRSGQPKGTAKTGMCVCVYTSVRINCPLNKLRKLPYIKCSCLMATGRQIRFLYLRVLTNICVYVRQKQRERIFWTVVYINDIICLLLCWLHCLIFPRWILITIPDSH